MPKKFHPHSQPKWALVKWGGPTSGKRPRTALFRLDETRIESSAMCPDVAERIYRGPRVNPKANSPATFVVSKPRVIHQVEIIRTWFFYPSPVQLRKERMKLQPITLHSTP